MEKSQFSILMTSAVNKENATMLEVLRKLVVNWLKLYKRVSWNENKTSITIPLDFPRRENLPFSKNLSRLKKVWTLQCLALVDTAQFTSSCKSLDSNPSCFVEICSPVQPYQSKILIRLCLRYTVRYQTLFFDNKSLSLC